MRPPPLAVMLDVAGRDVLVVGGGAVAARRVEALLDAGAEVRIVAPRLAGALQERHEARQLAWEARGFEEADVAGATLVVVATDDEAVNARAATAARAAGVLLNDTTVPERGDVAFSATVRRGALVVAVGSGGASPALTAFVRRRLEDVLEPELAALTALAERMRRRGRDVGLDAATREHLAESTLPRLLDLLRAGRAAEADRLADEVSAAAPAAGSTPWS